MQARRRANEHIPVAEGRAVWRRALESNRDAKPNPYPGTQVRAQLVGPKPKDRSSPYGTPKGLRSPLASPLVTDPQQVCPPYRNPVCVRAGCAQPAHSVGRSITRMNAEVDPERDVHGR